MTEQIQEIPQPTQPVQQIPVEPKKKLGLKIIVILLIVILLIGTGFIYAKKFLNKPKACTSEAQICPDGSSVGRTGPNCEFAPCPSQVPSATSTPDETANWKTYTDEGKMFTFKYPDYLEETIPRQKNSLSFRNISKTETGIVFILMTIGNKNTNETLDEFVDKNVLVSEYESVDPSIPTPSPYKLIPLVRELIIVDNQKAIWIEGSFDPSVNHIYVFVPYKSTSFIKLEFFEGTGGQSDRDIRQILSTFKFTD